MKPAPTSVPARITLFVLLLALLWGGNAVALKIGLAWIGPFFSAAIRFAIALILIVCHALITRVRIKPERSELLPLFLMDEFGFGQTWFCKWICPAGTLEAGLSLAAISPDIRSQLGFLFTWKFAILVLFVVWMIVSIALLGYAASGTLLSVFPRLMKIELDRMLTIAAALFSVSILPSYGASNHIPFDPSRLNWDRLQMVYISVYYLLLSVPYLLSGLAVALAVEKSGTRVNRLYFSSLFGSALGSIFVLPLFGLLTGPGVMVFASFTAGASALAFALNLKGRGFAMVVGWVLALLVLIPFAGSLLPVRISPYKSLIVALRYPDAELLETRWNAFSRVDVVKSGLVRHAPGLSLQYDALLPEQIGVIVNGDDLNAIT